MGEKYCIVYCEEEEPNIVLEKDLVADTSQKTEISKLYKRAVKQDERFNTDRTLSLRRVYYSALKHGVSIESVNNKISIYEGILRKRLSKVAFFKKMAYQKILRALE